MHPLWIVAIVIASLLVLYLILCWIVSRKILHMGVTPVAHTIDEAIATQIEEAKVDFTDYFHNWKKQDFQLDGLSGKLRGEVIFHPELDGQVRKKVAIVCHGHTWNRINSVKYANIFYDLGYSIVLYDHAYFGLSDGEYTTLGQNEKHDLSTVIDHTKSVFGNDCFLALHGESMGAVTVCCLLGLRNDVNLVVADCPFSHTMSYYRELCKAWTHLPAFPIMDFANATSKRKYRYDFNKTVPLDAVKGSIVPICFIHGDKDTLINHHHSEDLFEASGHVHSELHLFQGARHARSILLDKQKYYEVVTNFVVKIENLSNL